VIKFPSHVEIHEGNVVIRFFLQAFLSRQILMTFKAKKASRYVSARGFYILSSPSLGIENTFLERQKIKIFFFSRSSVGTDAVCGEEKATSLLLLEIKVCSGNSLDRI